jgi:lysophospholipase L1-like esterase
MNLKIAITDRLMGKLWVACRQQIARAQPGVGGIALLGDSITHMGKWDVLLPNLPIRNLGISGERSSHLVERLDAVIALQPDKLFLLIGTNDLGAGLPPDEIVRNVETLLARMRRDLPACALYVQAVMPRAAKFAARVQALNLRYREVAAKHAATFIDLFPVFDDGRGQMRADLTYDQLHLNGAGYLAWCEILGPHLA